MLTLIVIVMVVLGNKKRHSLGEVLPDRPPLERLGQIPGDKDRVSQPVGYAVPTVFQVPLDGAHVKVGILYHLQSSSHKA